MCNSQDGGVCSCLERTFVGAGHPLDGTFVVIVLSHREGKDPDLERPIQPGKIRVLYGSKMHRII